MLYYIFMLMFALVLSFFLALNPSSLQMKLSISEGSEDKIPTKFTSLENHDDLVISKTYWVRVQPSDDLKGEFILQTANPYIQNVSLFDEDGVLQAVGNKFSLSINENSKTYYLFYPFTDINNEQGISISLTDRYEFYENELKFTIYQTVFLSVLSFILFVSIFFIVRSKDKVYIYYALYIACVLLFFSYQFGILGNSIEIVNQIPPGWIWISSASLTYFYFLFARHFLNLKEVDPISNEVIIWGFRFIYLIITAESISLLVGFDLLHQVWYKILVMSVQVGLFSVFLYRIYRMKTVLSNYFLIGAMVLLFSTLGGQFASTFRFVTETNLFIQIGLLLDMFILSIGIAVRMDLIQKDRNLAQSKLIDQLKLNERLQQEYTDKLENQVAERTSALDKRNSENETLLREVHHRVKNNLQMITSLLSMQQRRLESDAAKNVISLTKNRVKSIGLIHEHLYKHEDFSKIDLYEYVWELTHMIVDSSIKNPKPKITFEIPKQSADIDTAIPIGIILNELITNCVKYAFNNHDSPTLTIRIEDLHDELIVKVVDNGHGASNDEIKSGFGHTIVNTLVQNISGSIHNESTKDGYVALIKLKEYGLF